MLSSSFNHWRHLRQSSALRSGLHLHWKHHGGENGVCLAVLTQCYRLCCRWESICINVFSQWTRVHDYLPKCRVSSPCSMPLSETCFILQKSNDQMTQPVKLIFILEVVTTLAVSACLLFYDVFFCPELEFCCSCGQVQYIMSILNFTFQDYTYAMLYVY